MKRGCGGILKLQAAQFNRVRDHRHQTTYPMPISPNLWFTKWTKATRVLPMPTHPTRTTRRYSCAFKAFIRLSLPFKNKPSASSNQSLLPLKLESLTWRFLIWSYNSSGNAHLEGLACSHLSRLHTHPLSATRPFMPFNRSQRPRCKFVAVTPSCFCPPRIRTAELEIIDQCQNSVLSVLSICTIRTKKLTKLPFETSPDAEDNTV